MLIAFSLYPAFTSLDVIGAYQVFANWPDTELTLVGPTKDPSSTTPPHPCPGGTIVTSEPAILEAVRRNMEADVAAGTRT